MRAARFQLEVPLAPSLDTYKPDEEQEALARRTVKFGVPYQPTDAVLMDMGGLLSDRAGVCEPGLGRICGDRDAGYGGRSAETRPGGRVGRG